jgi:hypothetical protein
LSPSEATAEVFWTAFNALPPDARNKFMEKMVADSSLREELEDLLDLDVAVERSSEPTRPLDEVLAELGE